MMCSLFEICILLCEVLVFYMVSGLHVMTITERTWEAVVAAEKWERRWEEDRHSVTKVPDLSTHTLQFSSKLVDFVKSTVHYAVNRQ
jgi:hypothetical protein